MQNFKLWIANAWGFLVANPMVIAAIAVIIGLVIVVGSLRSCNESRNAEKERQKLEAKQKLETEKLKVEQQAENDLAAKQKAEREANWERDNQKIKEAHIQTKQAEANLNQIKQGNYQGTSVEELEKKAKEFEP